MALPLFHVNDCVLVLMDHDRVDHPSEDRSGASSFTGNAMALARASEAFDVPVVRPMPFPEAKSGNAVFCAPSELTCISLIDECSIGRSEGLVSHAVHQARRGALIFAGRLSETLISYSILSALADTYDVLIAVDACDGLAPPARTLAMRRMAAAGATMTTSKDLLLRFEAERQWLDSAGALGTAAVALPSAGGAVAKSPARFRQPAEY